MADASHETHLAELLAKGMASEEEVAEARRLLAEAAARGAELSVAEALVRAGVMAARAHHAAPVVAADAATAAAEDTAAAAMPSSDLQVLEKLGRGSQAVVFKCRQISMDRIVAAKILLAKSARDAEARERFLGEARQAANLAHPNIVTIHQILPFAARSSSGDQTLDSFCIVMEYIDGGSVAELLAARKRFDPAEAACIIRPVAEALAFAHKRGIIHRDIKPGNILLTAGGLVKLADLGLAMPLTAAQQGSQAGRAYGTPYYISPEQVRGDADIDFRADLYSLAATFYEMIVGAPPFTAATPQEVMRKHLSEPVPDPRKQAPELPNALCWMLTRALAKDRAYRYESAEDFIAALEKLFPTVDAAAAGASAAADGESAAARADADPTVPAAMALVEQLAGAGEGERRRTVRAQPPAGKTVGKAGVPTRAAAVKRGVAAAEAARDPKRLRKRNMILAGVFGGLAVVGLAATVLLFVLFPPVEKDTAPQRFARLHASAPDAGTPAALAPAAPVAPAPVAPAPPPGQAGIVTLTADKADLHGGVIKYEKADQPGEAYRDNIGMWGNKDAYVSWDVTIARPGTYEVAITYAAPDGTGGAYTVEVAGQKLGAKTESTGGWHQFESHSLKGAIKIVKAGPATVTVRAVTLPKSGWLMNLQAVTLRRTEP